MTLMSSRAWETQCQTWFYRRGSQLVGRQSWNENSVPFFPVSWSSLLSNSHSISECQHQMISGSIWEKKKKTLFWSHYQLCSMPLPCLYNSRNGRHIHKVHESLFPIPVTFHQFPMLIFKTGSRESSLNTRWSLHPGSLAEGCPNYIFKIRQLNFRTWSLFKDLSLYIDP